MIGNPEAVAVVAEDAGTQDSEVYVFPVSFAQRRFWLLSQIETESSAYHLSGLLEIEGYLREDLLARSLAIVVQRHEILRTRFLLIDNEPAQVIDLSGSVRLQLVDLGGLTIGSRPSILDAVAERAAGVEFDLSCGPLLRCVLFRLERRRHVFLYTMHHIIGDGISEEILIREISFSYGALAGGLEPQLPELPIQYGDFSQWQRDLLQGPPLDRLIGYWRQQLMGVPTILRLPTDRSRPARFNHRGSSHFFSIPVSTASALTALGRDRGMTLFEILLTAFGLLLRLHAGDDELLVGSPAANRDRIELEHLIGPFLDTVVLRLDMGGSPTLSDLLNRVAETVRSALEHKDLPFERLISELGIERDSSRNPVFQAWFNLEMDSEIKAEVKVGEIRLRPLGLRDSQVKFDLLLNLRRSQAGVRGSFAFATALFDLPTVKRWAHHYQNLLASFTTEVDVPIVDLSPLSSAERHQVSIEWNDTERKGPMPEPVVRAFEHRAASCLDAPAVRSAAETLSFGRLDLDADQLASRLNKLGVGCEIPVAILLDRAPSLVVAILAVLKAGGYYVPIDPSQPRVRRDHILADVQPKVIITETALGSDLTNRPNLSVVYFDRLTLLEEEEKRQHWEVPEEALAYLIFTSGSSGRPKGVAISRGALNAYLRWCLDAYPVDQGRGAPLHSSIGFDLSVTSLFAPLLAGRAVTVIGEPWFEELLEALRRREGFSLLKLTPAQLDLLTRDLTAEEKKHAAVALILGGEALRHGSLEAWREEAPEIELINEYGPTETVVGCSTWFTRGDEGRTGEVSIGRPIADCSIHLLDRNFRSVPLGAVGEIAIGGAQVGRAYFGQPTLTADRFVPDPFSTSVGARLYLSGDLARWGVDGRIELLGRRDGQVKVRGYRVEPGEVERVLSAHNQVAEALVIAQATPDTNELVAYVVGRPGREVVWDELRRYLQDRLPEYMVPRVGIFLERFPLTANGKIDRKALPKLEYARSNTVELVPPRNILEEILCSIWEVALGIDKVGVFDNLFSLGGDSIRSIRIVALSRQRGFALSLPDVLGHPSVAQLATLLLARKGAPESHVDSTTFELVADQDRALLPDGIEDAYPLAGMQQGMLYHIDERPDAPVFHSINSYRLRLRFDLQAFRRAVLHLTARHPNLRTSFDLGTYSEPLQLVHEESYFPVAEVDLRGLVPMDQERSLKAFWEQELRTPFDLTRAPQLRFHLHRRSDDAFQFTLTENHAIIDGWSLHTLYGEILTCYLGLLRNGALPALPKLTTTFRDFVKLERVALASDASQAFWRRYIQESQTPVLPTVPWHRRNPKERRVDRQDILLPSETAEGLRELAKTLGVALKSVLLAAHVKVVSLFGGGRDVLTSVSSNGRPETLDGALICGLFLNTLPLRVRLVGGSWADLIRRTQEAELEILPHWRFPVSAIQGIRGRSQLLNTSFVYLNFHVLSDVVHRTGVEILDEGFFVEETNFAIMTAFQSSYTSNALFMGLDCDRSVFEDEQIREITNSYLTILDAMARGADERHDTFSPLDREALHLFRRWGESKPLVGSRESVVGRVLRRVETMPDFPAVSYGGQQVDYRDLGVRAARVASELVRCSLRSEARVALFLDRSPDLVAAIVGVLAAGAVYVPLEPSFPDDRLASMIEQAGCALLLTEERLSTRLRHVPIARLTIDSLAGDGPVESLRHFTVEVEPDQLAYVLFTSGSTGRPKAVGVSRRALTSYLDGILECLAPPTGASFAMVSTFSADLGVTMLFGALVTGGTLHLIDDETLQDSARFDEYGALNRFHALKIVPSHLASLLDHSEGAGFLPTRWLILGGEALDWELVDRVEALAPGCRIFNEYGPTETTVAVAIEEIPARAAERRTTRPSIGRPMLGSRLYVLDQDLQPTPPVVTGELFVGGDNLARGYLGAPELTAERFVPDDSSGKSGERLYRTGDLCRFLPDGRLEYLGRGDHQVKIRGYRVELGEVELMLRQLPGVQEAVVVTARQGAESVLRAFYSGTVEPIEVREAAMRQLPPHMQPANCTRLDTMPLTPNGKVDRIALMRLEPIRDCPRRVAPRSLEEHRLAQIWEEILGHQNFGVLDNFFDLGATSLSAVRLIARVRREFGLRLALSRLVEARTIEELSKLVGGGSLGAEGFLVPIRARGSQAPLYLVHPGHGTVVCYIDLVRHLAPDRPILGFQALDLDFDQSPYLSIEAMAARYIEAMLANESVCRPFLLGGWSFGGLIAYEMAQQLKEQGEEVAALILIDCSVPAISIEMARISRDRMRAFLLIDYARDVAVTAGASPLLLTPEEIEPLSFDDQLELLLAELEAREAFPADVDRDMLKRFFEVRLARIDAMNAYQPRPYDGTITLLRTTEVNPEIPLEEIQEIYRRAAAGEETYGWSAFSHHVDLAYLPGHHESMMREPLVRHLAEEINRRLEEVSDWPKVAQRQGEKYDVQLAK